ncbi:MAG: outer membrane beta-barrel protein, partial [Myxococcales bacterium]
ASFQFNWGDGSGTSGDSETGIYDVVLNYGGMEDVSMWANYTLVSVDDGDDTHGIAVAARMALNDGCGIAVRGEALLTDADVGDNSEEYSLTLTGDSALTDNLTAKVELRLDFSSDDTLPSSNGNDKEDVAAMALAQLVYEF